VHVLTAISRDLPRVAAQGIPMRQALVSILATAAHCTPEGSIHIDAAAEAGQVRLMVKPMHAGVAPSGTAGEPEALCPDDQDNVAMARQLVTLSGGSLRLEGADDGPFVATLVLPIAGQPAVLAIDDNEDSLRLLQRLLEGTRYPFVGASDPGQALELAASLSPQVIILDVMLPGMDGWELLGRLREHPATRDIPVIVSTILPHEQLALTLGAAAFLRKPVLQASLRAALNALIGPK
jgi:CheY-like chemotaxis protein